MSWIPELFPSCTLPLTPNPPLSGGKKGEPRLTDFAFHIFFFGKGGEGAVEVTVG